MIEKALIIAGAWDSFIGNSLVIASLVIGHLFAPWHSAFFHSQHQNWCYHPLSNVSRNARFYIVFPRWWRWLTCLLAASSIVAQPHMATLPGLAEYGKRPGRVIIVHDSQAT